MQCSPCCRNAESPGFGADDLSIAWRSERAKWFQRHRLALYTYCHSRKYHPVPTMTVPTARGRPTTYFATFRANVRCSSFIVCPPWRRASIPGRVALNSEIRWPIDGPESDGLCWAPASVDSSILRALFARRGVVVCTSRVHCRVRLASAFISSADARLWLVRKAVSVEMEGRDARFAV